MKAFGDASALVEVILSSPAAVTAFDAEHERVTRAHALVEVFSQLTGGRLMEASGAMVRLTPEDAARAISAHAAQMKVITLSPDQTSAAMSTARHKGVRGGQIHDLMHATAAEAEKVDRIYTLNIRHFEQITGLKVLAP